MSTNKYFFLIFTFFVLLILQVCMPNLGSGFVPRNLISWGFITIISGFCWSRFCMDEKKILIHKIWLLLFISPFGIILFTIFHNQSAFPYYPYTAIFTTFISLLFIGALVNLRLNLEHYYKIGLIICASMALLTINTLLSVEYFDISKIYRHIPSWLKAVDGGFQQRNQFASFLAAVSAYFYFVSAMSTQKKFKLIIFAFFYILFSIMILYSGSRTGLITLVASTLMLNAWSFRLNRSRQYILISISSLIFAFLITNYLIPHISTYSRLTDLNSGMSTLTRLTFFKVTWHMFLDAPMIGHGLGSFTIIYPNTLVRLIEQGYQLKFLDNLNLTHPHNEILLWLSETGIVGFLLIVCPWIFSAIYILSINKKYSLALFACLFPILFHAQVEFPLQDSSLHWLILGIIFSFGLSQSKNNWLQYQIKGRRIQIISFSIIMGVSILIASLLFRGAFMQYKLAINTIKEMTHEEFVNLNKEPEFSDPLTYTRAYDIYMGRVNILNTKNKSLLKNFVSFREGKLKRYFNMEDAKFLRELYKALGENEKFNELNHKIEVLERIH